MRLFAFVSPISYSESHLLMLLLASVARELPMKVREKVSGQIFEVYGIYWYGNRTCFYCFPKKGTGLSSYAESEVQITDPAIDGENEFRVTGNGIPGIFNRYLLRENLMDDLLEGSPEAFQKFATLLGRPP